MVAQQNGTVDVQRKNIGCIVIYIKEKKKVQTEDWRKKKKKVATIATVPLGIVDTVQNLKKKKKKRQGG